MPSPFPEMDPYLEAPTESPGPHHTLIVESVRLLQPELNARGYFADLEERVYLVELDQSYFPDITVTKARPISRPTSAAATSLVADRPALHPKRITRQREISIKIHQLEPRLSVTVIEILSLTNKQTTVGRKMFRKKQRDVHQSGMHLVEIDLRREGPGLSQIPQGVLDREGRFDYLFHIDRKGASDYAFYTIRLPTPLPKVAIPLRHKDADAVFDLQTALDASYDIGAFPMRIDYTLPPSPPLADDDALWADQLLKDKGLR